MKGELKHLSDKFKVGCKKNKYESQRSPLVIDCYSFAKWVYYQVKEWKSVSFLAILDWVNWWNVKRQSEQTPFTFSMYIE